jgi:hypothetical protein
MTELFKQKLTRKVGIVEETIALTVVRDGFHLELVPYWAVPLLGAGPGEPKKQRT